MLANIRKVHIIYKEEEKDKVFVIKIDRKDQIDN